MRDIGTLPKGAVEGPWAIGETIMVSRDSFGEGYHNPSLPLWFPGQACKPPEDEPGNWYRWYDPYIWYETEGDLSASDKPWCCGDRNKSYVGKLWYEGATDYWAIPIEIWHQLSREALS